MVDILYTARANGLERLEKIKDEAVKWKTEMSSCEPGSQQEKIVVKSFMITQILFMEEMIKNVIIKC